ncbi:MAG TPA: inorganic phosphate transporter [Verrucomicrobiae bacterium]|nr:inorganic phosphate transporter [Verrucomicrobiae bacterium]
MLLVLTVILVALIFTYTNGFHDTANAIATVVGTKVLTPRQAIMLATVMNLLGAMTGAAVAQTIASGLVDTTGEFIPPAASSEMLICALMAAIAWNLITWYFGMPSSSSHALVGGLCGAALAVAHGNWHAVIWSKVPAAGHPWWTGGGVMFKVVIPMFLSPVLGFIIAFILMSVLYLSLQKWRPSTVTRTFGRLQLFSSAYMGFSHGTNDAQKTMGIIALALVAATKAGAFDSLPGWLDFLKTAEPGPGESLHIALWIKVLCALTMAAGTAIGGWRIIKTLGHKLVKLQPVHGFAAETAGASVLLGTALFGMPVSTTHVITTSIMGVGAAKRWNAMRWVLAEQIVWAWIFTLPVSGAIAYGLVKLAGMF